MSNVGKLRIEELLLPAGSSRTLPAAAIRSSDVFGWEQRELFAGGWLCMGRTGELLAPGQLRAIEVGGESILLSRSSEGITLAFSNVCRHRGHILMEPGDAVDARQIRCPYHSWAYRFDGSLRSAPSLTQTEDFDLADWPLTPVGVAEWLGWLFVNLSGAAVALPAMLGSLGDVLEGYEPERLVGVARHDYEVAANWKLIVENYLECYHCTTIHPALCEVTPWNSGVSIASDGMWCGGTMQLKAHAVTMSISGESGGVPFRNLGTGRDRDVLYLAVFPNLLISAHPDYLLTHRLVPLSPDRTHVECNWLFAPESLGLDGFDPAYAIDFWDLTNQEDWAACEGVQRGAANRGFSPGPLSWWELSIHQFHAMVSSAYLGEGLVPPPAMEWVAPAEAES